MSAATTGKLAVTIVLPVTAADRVKVQAGLKMLGRLFLETIQEIQQRQADPTQPPVQPTA